MFNGLQFFVFFFDKEDFEFFQIQFIDVLKFDILKQNTPRDFENYQYCTFLKPHL